MIIGFRNGHRVCTDHLLMIGCNLFALVVGLLFCFAIGYLIVQLIAFVTGAWFGI